MHVNPVMIRDDDAMLVAPVIKAGKRKSISFNACSVSAFKGISREPTSLFDNNPVAINCKYLGFRVDIFFVPCSQLNWIVTLDRNIVKHVQSPRAGIGFHEYMGIVLSEVVNHTMYDYIECSGDDVNTDDFTIETTRLHARDAIIPVLPIGERATHVTFTIATAMPASIVSGKDLLDLTGTIPLIVSSTSLLSLQKIADFLTPDRTVSMIHESIKSSTRPSYSPWQP